MTLITADNLNAQGQRVRFDPAGGYTLIYSGTGDDPFADTWPDIKDQCLHTRSHARNRMWQESPRRDLDTAEANARDDGRCKSCLPAEGDLP
jgi:hypothetical protein